MFAPWRWRRDGLASVMSLTSIENCPLSHWPGVMPVESSETASPSRTKLEESFTSVTFACPARVGTAEVGVHLVGAGVLLRAALVAAVAVALEQFPDVALLVRLVVPRGGDAGAVGLGLIVGGEVGVDGVEPEEALVGWGREEFAGRVRQVAVLLGRIGLERDAQLAEGAEAFE